MKMLHKLALAMVFAALLGAAWQVSAQVVDDIEPRQTRSEQREQRSEDRAEYTATAGVSDAQIAENTRDIAHQAEMSGNQDFILKLLAIIMPLLTAVLAGVILILQQKQKVASEQRAESARNDLILVARSINGIKTELVARSELAAFMEGASAESSDRVSEAVALRRAELAEAVRVAAKKADASAEAAILTMAAKGKAAPVQPIGQLIPLAPGEQQTLEGTLAGEDPVDADAIAVVPGDIKTVIGAESKDSLL